MCVCVCVWLGPLALIGARGPIPVRSGFRGPLINLRATITTHIRGVGEGAAGPFLLRPWRGALERGPGGAAR